MIGGDKKKEYFQSLGLKIHILREVAIEQKGLSSSDIRESMMLGAKWEHLGPSSVENLMKQWNISQRLKKIWLK